MEKQIALVNKTTNRVENIIVVDSFDNAQDWSTSTLDAIPLENEKIAFVNGLYDGTDFTEPTNDYLVEIGLLTPIDEEAQAEAEAKAEQKAALLERLGITAEEAQLLLGGN
jgi:hypothetical protein